MSEPGVLKRSAFMYGFSIFFTGMVNFIAIPVLKQKTGSEEFAYLNLYMNMLLVLNYIGAGWLVQSCIRFYHSLSGQGGFSRIFKRLAIISSLVTAAISLLLICFFSHYRWMFIGFPLAIIFVSLQCIAISWMQANIQPKIVAAAEVLRSLIFLATIFLVQPAKGYNIIIAVWTGWVFAYAVSLVFILLFIRRQAKGLPVTDNPADGKVIFNRFARFGLPISLWMAASYCLYFADRFFLVANEPASRVGHYSAVADIVQKGMGFLLSPLVAAAYPLLARLYEASAFNELRQLSRKVLRFQLILSAAAMAAYIFGWPLLTKMLGIQDNKKSLFIPGLFILAGAATWQINMMLHKPFELAQKTGYLLRTVSICVALLLLSNWWVVPRYGFIGAAAIFFGTTILYTVIIFAKRKTVQHSASSQPV